VVRLHSGNGPHAEMNERAVACFDQALTDAGFDAGSPVRKVLHDYFAWSTFDSVNRYEDSADDAPTVCRSRSGPGTGSSAESGTDAPVLTKVVKTRRRI
jgi:hypothetical protein